MEEQIDYTINDNIVAIQSHSQGVFKNGQEFVAKGLSLTPCCNKPLVNVGIINGAKFTRCGYCKNIRPAESIFWFMGTLFRKLPELSEIQELTEVLTETKPFETT